MKNIKKYENIFKTYDNRDDGLPHEHDVVDVHQRLTAFVKLPPSSAFIRAGKLQY